MGLSFLLATWEQDLSYKPYEVAKRMFKVLLYVTVNNKLILIWITIIYQLYLAAWKCIVWLHLNSFIMNNVS